ncbi:polysaccharide biosynthesis tyrosine autokinase [Corynebacterium sp. H127]|uniref:polysaccharide biosynthesis tyrosine autokinase n=1 Tax=Corynebacterium sp. H127 TaxID=3133418 RepID=UPI0030B2464F
MEIRDYVSIIRKNWVLIVVASVLGLVAGAAYSAIVTPEYQSRTQLYVSVRSEAGTTGDLVQGANYSRQVVNSYVDVIGSSVVLQPVIDELGLEMSASTLAKQVTAVSPNQTALIDITASSQSADESAAIANAVGESFKRVVYDQLEPSSAVGQNPVNITTIQLAEAPAAPVSPKIALNVLLGLLVGLALGLGLAVLRSILDTRIHSLRDVEEVTDKPLLGGVIDDPNASKNPLTLQTKPYSPRAESFRALRTNLQFVNYGDDFPLFVMTSANPGEGKSTTSANLSLALAETGAKVALVEADLRLPMVHKFLSVEGGAGLTDVLIGKADLTDVLQRWGRTSLYFLPAGKIPPNPSELLGSEAMSDVLESLCREFDYVVVDAPPVLAVTDAAVIGHGKSKVLVAVASGATKKPELKAALSVLETAGCMVAGIIVNMLPAKGAGSYGYGNYGYGDGIKSLKDLDESNV